MFSAKKTFKELRPSERSALTIYVVRPYIIKLAVELGIPAETIYAHPKDVDDLMVLCQKTIRHQHRRIKDLEKLNTNQRRKVEELAQTAFGFMSRYEREHSTG